MTDPNTVARKTNNTEEESFSKVVQNIEASREKALQAVNAELIELYWQIGETISLKIKEAAWRESVMGQLAAYISKTQSGKLGFTRANLSRMRQFYETYCGDEKLAPLLRQLPWTHHLIILGESKRPEEREFYIRLAAQEKWSKQELEHQFKSALFERAVMTPTKASPLGEERKAALAELSAYDQELGL
jgi:predicted nuclease of restriction endonuclease-like (RecB) superfamily